MTVRRRLSPGTSGTGCQVDSRNGLPLRACSSVRFIQSPDQGTRHHDDMTLESRHLGKHIDVGPDQVYAYASDPANLPRWAPGPGNAVEQVDGQWFVDTP